MIPTDAVRDIALVVGTGPAADRLHSEIAEIFSDHGDAVLVADSAQAQAWLGSLSNADSHASMPVRVSLVAHLAGADAGDDLMQAITALPFASNAKYLMVTDLRTHSDLNWIINEDRLIGVLSQPWTHYQLKRILDYHLRRREEDADWYQTRRAELPSLSPQDVRRVLPKPPVTPEEVESRLLANLAMSPDDAVQALVEAIEDVIGPRPRIHVRAGVRITHEDDEMHAIMLVLRGRVSMTMQTRVGEVVLHHASTGPVVGLLSLADQRRAFFTARTTTECVLVHMTTQQLDRALEASPKVGAALTAVSIRVLSMRLRRAQNLHIEKLELASQLDEERERLAETLTALENARTQLVAQARFATLGEISAGIAHELNNPIAAISRAAEHLLHDVNALIATHPRREVLTNAIESALNASRGSAAEERAWRREVEKVVKDRNLARRLVSAGIRDKASAKAARKHVELVEIGAGIGNSLRNLQQGSEHVVSLVQSLRTQTRPETAEKMAVDVVASLERAARLAGHRLHDVKVVWRVGAEIPEIQAHPASLAQVWTNQLVNAADAMADYTNTPQIRISVQAVGEPGPDHAVRVSITDNGKGILPEDIERIFHPQFTTKHGTVRYGLGMGLGITRNIVEGLGGTIMAASEPGKTTFTTILPVNPPDEPAKQTSSPEIPAYAAPIVTEDSTAPDEVHPGPSQTDFAETSPLLGETGTFALIDPAEDQEQRE